MEETIHICLTRGRPRLRTPFSGTGETASTGSVVDAGLTLRIWTTRAPAAQSAAPVSAAQPLLPCGHDRRIRRLRDQGTDDVAQQRGDEAEVNRLVRIDVDDDHDHDRG